MALDWLVYGGIVLALDQGAKALILARAGDAPGDADRSLGPRIRAVLTRRMGQGLIGSRQVVGVLWVVLIVGLIGWMELAPGVTAPARAAAGAALGGASGNTLDLFRRGAVVDFIDLRFWPVFNLADVAIVVGGFGALAAIW